MLYYLHIQYLDKCFDKGKSYMNCIGRRIVVLKIFQCNEDLGPSFVSTLNFIIPIQMPLLTKSLRIVKSSSSSSVYSYIANVSVIIAFRGLISAQLYATVSKTRRIDILFEDNTYFISHT